jgi:hypothetical protein
MWPLKDRIASDDHNPRPSMTASTIDFGNWHLDPTTLELVLKRQDWIRIDLERCNTSGDVLDWIFHYRAKNLSDKDLADMLHALELILQPRSNLCSFGANKTIDSSALVNAYVQQANEDGT